MWKPSHCLLRLVLAGGFALGVSADERQEPTQLFGITSSGSSFVYVFDRSLSMQGPPLAAAKRELLQSLSRLKPVQQFQIIFYNERPRVMRLDGAQGGSLLFADDSGQQAAASFVASITADGGTDHLGALKLALRMRPDVVFFLTDADDPALSKAELAELQRANNGTIIHAVEFKPGPDQGKGQFLHTLAAQHGGQHTYVDTAKLTTAR